MTTNKDFDFDTAIEQALQGVGPWKTDSNPHGFADGKEFHASLLRRLKGFVKLFNDERPYPKQAVVLNYPRTVFHNAQELMHRIMELCEILNLQDLTLRLEREDGETTTYSLRTIYTPGKTGGLA